VSPPLQLWEPLLAIGGAAFMIYIEVELGKFFIHHIPRWHKRFQESRIHRWLDSREPGVRINCRDGSCLSLGWVRH
jgi:hypothetical protein